MLGSVACIQQLTKEVIHFARLYSDFGIIALLGEITFRGEKLPNFELIDRLLTKKCPLYCCSITLHCPCIRTISSSHKTIQAVYFFSIHSQWSVVAVPRHNDITAHRCCWPVTSIVDPRGPPAPRPTCRFIKANCLCTYTCMSSTQPLNGLLQLMLPA